MEKQDKLFKDNNDLRKKCEKYDIVLKVYSEMKVRLEKLKKENAALKVKCNSHDVILKEINVKVKVSSEGVKKMEERHDK